MNKPFLYVKKKNLGPKGCGFTKWNKNAKSLWILVQGKNLDRLLDFSFQSFSKFIFP